MNVEQGPLWGCDRECGARADTMTPALALFIGGEVHAA